MLNQRSDRPGAAHATDRFGMLFVQLLVLLGLSAFGNSMRIVNAVQGLLVVSIVLTTLLATGTTPRMLRRSVAGAAALAVVIVAAGLFDDAAVRAALAFVSAAVLGLGVVAVVRRIFERPAITGQEILAALAAYLEIALVFTFIYVGLAEIAGSAFFVQDDPGGIAFLYFSVVTMTTLGYGDLTPATDAGRTLVMIQTLFGQIFLVVLVAYLVGSLRPHRPAAADDG